MVRVKICGLTRLEDALLAADLGADALGFIFAESPRRITPEKARAIIEHLPPFIQTVGVFVNQEPARIKEIVDFCGLDLIQLHGQEPPELCRELRPRSIKAFRIGNEGDLTNIDRYSRVVRAVLLDTLQEGMAGGTGKTFDWSLAVKAKAFGLPILLAGGLNPDNIQQALQIVGPWAVDVNSGVEIRPGVKDPALLKRLMDRITEVRTCKERSNQ